MALKCKIGFHTWHSTRFEKDKENISWDVRECSYCRKARIINEKEIIRILKNEYRKAGDSLYASPDVKSIGEALDYAGGLNLMRYIANKAVGDGVRSLWMNHAWHKIGRWLA